MILCGSAEKDKVFKIALLANSLGWEGSRQFFYMAGDKSTLQEVVSSLESIFKPRRTIVATRFAFRRRKQRAGDSVLEYLNELRREALDCDFRMMEAKLVRDQFIAGLMDMRIQERLLMEENLSLERAIQTAISMEMVYKI